MTDKEAIVWVFQQLDRHQKLLVQRQLLEQDVRNLLAQCIKGSRQPKMDTLKARFMALEAAEFRSDIVMQARRAWLQKRVAAGQHAEVEDMITSVTDELKGLTPEEHAALAELGDDLGIDFGAELRRVIEEVDTDAAGYNKYTVAHITESVGAVAAAKAARDEEVAAERAAAARARQITPRWTSAAGETRGSHVLSEALTPQRTALWVRFASIAWRPLCHSSRSLNSSQNATCTCTVHLVLVSVKQFLGRCTHLVGAWDGKQTDTSVAPCIC